MDWIISANSNIYNHESSFIDNGYIDWRQGLYKYQIGDIVYIYCTKPLKRIRYKCIVEKTNLTKYEILNDYEYWIDKSEYEKSLNGLFFRLRILEDIASDNLSLDRLLSLGLKMAPRGPQKLKGNLLNFISEQFSCESKEYFPDAITINEDLYEGAIKKIYVNKYERSSIARIRCIEAKGYRCSICDFDFKEVYGEIGESFIHVHHIVPLNKVNSKYKINFAEDLIPVCPNCHAMLHRKINGNNVTIEELKALLRRA